MFKIEDGLNVALQTQTAVLGLSLEVSNFMKGNYREITEVISILVIYLTGARICPIFVNAVN